MIPLARDFGPPAIRICARHRTLKYTIGVEVTPPATQNILTFRGSSKSPEASLDVIRTARIYGEFCTHGQMALGCALFQDARARGQGMRSWADPVQRS